VISRPFTDAAPGVALGFANELNRYGDATALIDQVGGLLTASEDGEGFARRYFEALQRQPAVVLAHADVRRVLKGMRSSN